MSTLSRNILTRSLVLAVFGLYGSGVAEALGLQPCGEECGDVFAHVAQDLVDCPDEDCPDEEQDTGASQDDQHSSPESGHGDCPPVCGDGPCCPGVPLLSPSPIVVGVLASVLVSRSGLQATGAGASTGVGLDIFRPPLG